MEEDAAATTRSRAAAVGGCRLLVVHPSGQPVISSPWRLRWKPLRPGRGSCMISIADQCGHGHYGRYQPAEDHRACQEIFHRAIPPGTPVAPRSPTRSRSRPGRSAPKSSATRNRSLSWIPQADPAERRRLCIQVIDMFLASPPLRIVRKAGGRKAAGGEYNSNRARLIFSQYSWILGNHPHPVSIRKMEEAVCAGAGAAEDQPVTEHELQQITTV